MLVLYLFSAVIISFSVTTGACSSIVGLGLRLRFSIDESSLVFFVTLLTISISVTIWSYYYLDNIVSYRGFLVLLFLFLFAMYGLIFSADLLGLLCFWDLLGFTSFFLVIYYRTRSRLASGFITGVTNRIGDCFLLSFFGLAGLSGSLSLGLYVCLLIAVRFTKSAQFPFSIWLPAAISAPTPVSALVHSRTLVTAGVYLLFRFVPLYFSLLVYTGVLTTFLAGLAAFFESDFKKIIALSTLSQLGIIMTGLGLGQRTLCFIHLNIHASYKALLFMAVGILIHGTYGSQGFRKLGTLVASSSLVGVRLLLACVSMCGLVFTSGWVSKDTILASAFCTSTPLSLVIFFYFGLVLTVAYRIRIVYWASSVHSAHLPSTCTLNLGSVLKFPLYSLCSLRILQGMIMPPVSHVSNVILRSWCFVSFWGARFFGIYLGMSINPSVLIFSSPFDWLKHSIELFGSVWPSVNTITFHENAFICGGGLAWSSFVLRYPASTVSVNARNIMLLGLLLLVLR